MQPAVVTVCRNTLSIRSNSLGKNCIITRLTCGCFVGSRRHHYLSAWAFCHIPVAFVALRKTHSKMNSFSFRGSCLLMCVVAVLLMPCASSARLHAHGRRLREGLPIISHIGSVTLGVTTIDELEARYGKGLPCLGGHSDGARLWAVSGTNLRIWADGFDYSDKGRVVYSFVIDSDNGPVDKSIPIVSPKVADLAFLSRILPNMRMKEVRKILLQSHVPFTTYKT